MKLRFAFIGVVIITTVFGGTVGAVSEDVMGAVSMNCASIVGQIKNVKYYDRKAREYLGNRYERMIGGYVTNMNVRLVRNNITEVRLQELQVELVRAHGEFKTQYGRYANDLDGLIVMDCVNSPGEFYTKLVQIRSERAKVRERVEVINSGLSEYRDKVVSMKEWL